MSTAPTTNRTFRTIASANNYHLNANRNANAEAIASVVAGLTSAHAAIDALCAAATRIAPAIAQSAHDNSGFAGYFAPEQFGPRQLRAIAFVDEALRLNYFADDEAAVAMWRTGADVEVAPEVLPIFWATDLDDNDEVISFASYDATYAVAVEQEHDDALLDCHGYPVRVSATVSLYVEAHDEWRTEATVYAIIGDNVEVRLPNGARLVRPARQVATV